MVGWLSYTEELILFLADVAGGDLFEYVAFYAVAAYD